MDKYYYWREQNFYVHVLVAPRAKQNRIVGVHGDKLKIQIASTPTDGKANAQLIKFLAQCLKLPQSNIEIVRGEHSTDKLVCITNPAPNVLEKLGVA